MVMPLCGTFHYAGVVPGLQVSQESGQWTFEDQSGAETVPPVDSPASWKLWKRLARPAGGHDRLRDNRLVGLQPVVRISGSQLILQAASRHRAEVRSASVELDRTLLEGLQPGDRIELVRTGTADIGVSVLRTGELLWAVGAVTTVPLGPILRVRGGPTMNSGLDEWPRKDTWVDVSIEGDTSRLHDGEELNLSEYRVTLVRAFKDGIPGHYENVAVSRDSAGVHEAVARVARILGGGNAGLTMTAW
jgi:hypothetical protein